MNPVAADVRRLILFPAKEVRASLRRLLRHKGRPDAMRTDYLVSTRRTQTFFQI